MNRQGRSSARAGARAVAVLIGGLFAAIATMAPAAGASAATDPNWWYPKYDVAGAASAGLTGAGIKIGIVDDQINPALPVFQGAQLTVHEPGMCGAPAATSTADDGSVHGSDITALILGNGTGSGSVRGIAPGASVTFYSSPGTGAEACVKTIDGVRYSSVGLGIKQALADGNRIVSISQALVAYQPGDIAVIAQAIASGVIVVGANNNELTQKAVYPFGANGVVAVNAFQENGDIQQTNSGQTVAFESTTVVAAGDDFSSQGTGDPTSGWGDDGTRLFGASLATPLVSGMLALTAQKYPAATGNQLLQSLIHNTGADDHAVQRYDGGYGYGAASLSHLLRVDPAQYPDENPLMNEPDRLGEPTAADVEKAAGGGTPTTPSETGSASAAPRGSTSPIPAVLIAAAVVGGLIIIAVVIVVIVLLTRRRGAPGQGGIR